jgi:hypothetical protein
LVLFAMAGGLAFTSFAQQEAKPNPVTAEMVEQAQKIMGLDFSEAKRDSMLENLADQLEDYKQLRIVSLPNSVPPAILFNPIPVGFQFEKARKAFKKSAPGVVKMPKTREELAFHSIGQLSELIRTHANSHPSNSR